MINGKFQNSGTFQNNAINDVKQILLNHVINLEKTSIYLRNLYHYPPLQISSVFAPFRQFQLRNSPTFYNTLIARPPPDFFCFLRACTKHYLLSCFPDTAKNTVILPNFLVCRPKLCGNCAFPQNFYTKEIR